MPELSVRYRAVPMMASQVPISQTATQGAAHVALDVASGSSRLLRSAFAS